MAWYMSGETALAHKVLLILPLSAWGNEHVEPHAKVYVSEERTAYFGPAEASQPICSFTCYSIIDMAPKDGHIRTRECGMRRFGASKLSNVWFGSGLYSLDAGFVFEPKPEKGRWTISLEQPGLGFELFWLPRIMRAEGSDNIAAIPLRWTSPTEVKPKWSADWTATVERRAGALWVSGPVVVTVSGNTLVEAGALRKVFDIDTGNLTHVEGDFVLKVLDLGYWRAELPTELKTIEKGEIVGHHRIRMYLRDYPGSEGIAIPNQLWEAWNSTKKMTRPSRLP